MDSVDKGFLSWSELEQEKPSFPIFKSFYCIGPSQKEINSRLYWRALTGQVGNYRSGLIFSLSELLLSQLLIRHWDQIRGSLWAQVRLSHSSRAHTRSHTPVIAQENRSHVDQRTLITLAESLLVFLNTFSFWYISHTCDLMKLQEPYMSVCACSSHVIVRWSSTLLSSIIKPAGI